MLAGILERHPKPQRTFLSFYNQQMLLQALKRDPDFSILFYVCAYIFGFCLAVISGKKKGRAALMFFG
jgi:hypothetical protein